MPAEAAAEFEKANRLYHQLPRSANVRAFEADGEIALAEIKGTPRPYFEQTSPHDLGPAGKIF
jgi:hypothetical protein